MGTPFIVARQPSQSPLSLTGICYEVSDKLGRVETTVSTGEPQNELSVLLRRWRVCLLQQILHHSEQMNSLDGNTMATSAVVTRWRTELRVVLLRRYVATCNYSLLREGGIYLHPSSLFLYSSFCQDPCSPEIIIEAQKCRCHLPSSCIQVQRSPSVPRLKSDLHPNTRQP